MKSYAAWTPAPANEETEYTNQSNCHICGAKHDMDNYTFSKNRLLKREVGHWQKRSCVMGVIFQLLQTLMPELVVTEGYIKFVIKSIQQICKGMCQREEAEVTLQQYLQLIL